MEENIEHTEIIAIYKVGSISWQSSTNKDNDVVLIANSDIAHCPPLIRNDMHIDAFVYPLEKWEQMATAKLLHYSPYIGLLSEYPENLMYGELPISNYNWFDYQGEALLREYEYASKNYFTDKMINKFTNFNCSKRMCLGLITYYAIQNQSFKFTDEQKNIIQKCHDLELPISYREELKTNIESKLKEWALI